MFKTNKWRLLLLPIAAATIAGCSLLPEEGKPLGPPLVKPVEARVVTAEARIDSIEKIVQGVGRFQSTDMSYHYFKTAGGRVEAVHVRAGDPVEAEDALVTLETPGLDKDLIYRKIDLEKKKLALKEAKLAENADRLRIAELELEASQMEYDERLQLQRQSVLRTERSGIVVFVKEMKPTDYVNTHDVLVVVADPHNMRLAFDAGGNPGISAVDVGMEALVTAGDSQLAGVVVQTPSSAPATDDARLREEYNRTLYIEFDELPVSIKFGDMATVRIVTARKDGIIVVPKQAVRNFSGRTYVQVLEGESRREVDVETGLESSTQIEIAAGLEEGALVIVQ